jgi:hypothetical protein
MWTKMTNTPQYVHILFYSNKELKEIRYNIHYTIFELEVFFK